MQNGSYAIVRSQLDVLAACRMSIAIRTDSGVSGMQTTPLSRCDAWLDNSKKEFAGAVELSEEFYFSLSNHEVPLDYRAIAALRHSTIALDIYSWLAHRLCRITAPQGARVTWANLREQFGQEYADPRNFKREFRQALRQVQAVYPDARIQPMIGGLALHSSRPPLANRRTTLTWRGVAESLPPAAQHRPPVSVILALKHHSETYSTYPIVLPVVEACGYVNELRSRHLSGRKLTRRVPLHFGAQADIERFKDLHGPLERHAEVLVPFVTRHLRLMNI